MTTQELKHLENTIIHKLKQELPLYYRYHSVDHILRVLEKATLIASYQKATKKETKLIQIAALFHDTGFIKSHQNHEEISCEIAKEYLANYAMNADEINKIIGMIMATKIPQTPHNYLDEILADADLEYLGTNDFERISGYLFLELKHLNPDLTEKKWHEIQINFMEKHTYFTDYGKKYLCDVKNKNLKELKEKYLKSF